MADRKKIIINEAIAEMVSAQGYTFNQALEKMYEADLAAARSNPVLKDKSATKIALIDAGLRGNSIVNEMFTTSANEFLFPAYMADIVDLTMQRSDVMNFMVGSTSNIPANVVKAPTLDLLSDENKDKIKKVKVAEGTDIPMRTVTVGSETVSLFKKGIGVKQTYEAARAMRIDMVTRLLNAVSSDIVHQNVDAITKTLEKSVTNIGTTKTANVITRDELLDAFIAYFVKFGYAPTTIVAGEDMFKSLFKVVYGSDEMAGVTDQIKLKFPTMKLDDVAVIPADVAKASSKNRILLYNKEYGIDRWVETGSELNEFDKNIINQTSFATISEVSGYSSFTKNAMSITSA